MAIDPKYGWCVVCLRMNLQAESHNEPAVTISGGNALCTKHFVSTQPGVGRKVRKAWRAAKKEWTR